MHIPFDTLDRYYNSHKKKIVLPDKYEDDIWAGEYYFRRDTDEFVSVEMKKAYIDTLTIRRKDLEEKFYDDSTRMFVFASMYTNKSKADSLFKILKPKFPKLTIIPTKIYQGCMH